MAKIIKLDRSIIPACDVESIEKLKQIVGETCDIDGIGDGFRESLTNTLLITI